MSKKDQNSKADENVETVAEDNAANETKKGMSSTDAVAAVRKEFPKHKGGRYVVGLDGKVSCSQPPSKPPEARKEHKSKSNV